MGRCGELHLDVQTELPPGIDAHNPADLTHDRGRNVPRSFVRPQPGGSQVEIVDAP